MVMNLMKDIWKVINSPLVVISENNYKRKLLLSAVLVLTASVLNGIIAPILYYLTFKNEFIVKMDLLNIFVMFIFCIITFLTACGAFKLTALVFRKEVSFNQILATWGCSYIPTLICVVLVSITELSFYYFINNTMLGVLTSTLLIMLLMWKAIFYFIELNIVLKINGTEAVMATMIIGFIYLIIIFVGFRVGVKVPLL